MSDARYHLIISPTARRQLSSATLLVLTFSTREFGIESARARSAAESDRIAMVSSSESRSSTASSTADGRPCTVTVTRSCCFPTRPLSSDRCALTWANGNVLSDMVTTMTNRHVGVQCPRAAAR